MNDAFHAPPFVVSSLFPGLRVALLSLTAGVIIRSVYKAASVRKKKLDTRKKRRLGYPKRRFSHVSIWRDQMSLFKTLSKALLRMMYRTKVTTMLTMAGTRKLCCRAI